MDKDWCWTVEGSVADWHWMGRLVVNRWLCWHWIGVGFLYLSGIGIILVGLVKGRHMIGGLVTDCRIGNAGLALHLWILIGLTDWSSFASSDWYVLATLVMDWICRDARLTLRRVACE